MKGKLYLVPTVLSEDSLHVIPAYVHDIIKNLRVFFVENEKTARRYLRKTGYTASFDETIVLPVNEHTNKQNFSEYVTHLLQGVDCGLMSDAGVPAVADPGAELVKLCHDKNITVIPLTGPSSILLALMASGLNGQQFFFHGYIPVKQPDRRLYLLKMEANAQQGITQMFIETPYRNNTLLADILQTCSPATKLCIASDITGKKEWIQTKSVADWKKNIPVLEKIPAVFLIG